MDSGADATRSPCPDCAARLAAQRGLAAALLALAAAVGGLCLGYVAGAPDAQPEPACLPPLK